MQISTPDAHKSAETLTHHHGHPGAVTGCFSVGTGPYCGRLRQEGSPSGRQRPCSAYHTFASCSLGWLGTSVLRVPYC